MNRWFGVGRITKDLELKKTTNGKSFINFLIAIDRPYSNAQGQKETDFINCVAWNKTAENMATYVGKGSLIAIDGRIQTRNYENNEGKRVYVTEIMAEYVQFLDSKKDNQPKQEKSIVDEFMPTNEVNSDDLPF